MKIFYYAGCFVVNSQHKILLQFRGPSWKTFSNCWCIFGSNLSF